MHCLRSSNVNIKMLSTLCATLTLLNIINLRLCIHPRGYSLMKYFVTTCILIRFVAFSSHFGSPQTAD